MELSELIKQAPYLASVVIIVIAFLRAQEKQDTMFLTAMKERDETWQKSILELSGQIHQNGEQIAAIGNIVTSHDAAMKVTAKTLERGQRRPMK